MEQRHEFHDNLHKLQGYCTKALQYLEEYDGNRIAKIIDGFGTFTAQQLTVVEQRRFEPDGMKGLADALKTEG